MKHVSSDDHALIREIVMSTSTTLEADHEDLAIDEARAFVGPNASFYDECWRVMLWRGKTTSWNPHAALLGPVWFAYRRMFAPALVWLACLQLLWLAHDRGLSPWFLLALLSMLMAASGLFANAVYLNHFTRRARLARKASDSVLAQEQRLIKEGGVSAIAAGAFAAITIALTLANLATPLEFTSVLELTDRLIFA